MFTNETMRFLHNPAVREVVERVLVEQVLQLHPRGEFSSLGAIVQVIDINRLNGDERELLPNGLQEGAIVLAAQSFGWILPGQNGFQIPTVLFRDKLNLVFPS